MARYLYLVYDEWGLQVLMAGFTEAATPDSDFDLTADRIIRRTRERLLAPAIFGKLARFFRLEHRRPGATLPLVLLLVAYTLGTVTTRLEDRSGAVLDGGRAVLVFVCVFALWIVNWLHDSLFPVNVSNIVRNCESMAGVQAIEDWFKGFLSLGRQIAVSAVLAILLIPTLLVVQQHSSVRFHLTAHLLGVPCLFLVSHGAYCAYNLPTLTRVVSEQGMKTFWMVPAETPWIGTLGFGFNMLSLAEAVVLAFCIGGMYWLKPWESRQVILISAIWLMVGLLVVFYGFSYPQIHLARVVRAARVRQIDSIQCAMRPCVARLGSLTEEEQKQLSGLLELQGRLLASKQSVLDVKTISTFVTSLVLPIASFVLGRLGVLPQSK
jgi:hypothetical protein